MKTGAKVFLIGTIGLVTAVVLSATGYVGYVLLSYNRLGYQSPIVQHNSGETSMPVGTQFRALTYDLSYGARSQDRTYFLDTGFDNEGNPTRGESAKGASAEEVNRNINGAFAFARKQNAVLHFFQSVDKKADRSYGIDEDYRAQQMFYAYDHVYAVDYHTPFLPYPFNDMSGSAISGMATFSFFPITYAARRELPVAQSMAKFFDIDRCYSYAVVPTSNGKRLYAVNVHLSTYAEPEIRNAQIRELNDFLAERKTAGDYVIAGGNWNYDLLSYNLSFSSNGGFTPTYDASNRPFAQKKKDPEWVTPLFHDKDGNVNPFMEGFRVVVADNAPTRRNGDIAWSSGESYVCVLDGFLVSDNVTVVSNTNLKTTAGKLGTDGFAYSDHDPASLDFILNA